MATVTRIDPTNLTLQSYEAQDSNLISQFDVNTVLTGSSYIEFFVYDNNTNLLYSTYNYNSYTVLNDGQSAGNNNEINQFNITPGDDVENQGFDQGEYISYYNFLTKQLGDPNTNFFIQEISSDRTEIRLDSNILSNLDIVEQTNKFIQFRDDSTYFVDFYLNLGDNDLVIANNVQLENESTDDPTVLVKLYEPLPPQFELKDQLWVVTTLNEPEAFNVNFPPQPIQFIDFTNLSGPNFNIPIKDQVNNSTQNLSYNDILSGSPTSSLDQLNSLMDSSSLSISVDYTDFTDFIHFSSVQTRLENFYYKVQLITGYSSSISSLTNVTSSATSTTILQSKISEITKNFDKYEYFLYYDSGSSYSWPKTTTEPPYLLATTGSTTVLNWFGSVNEQSSNFGGLILSASNYDNANKDQLLKSIPEYLREDPANRQYDLFVDMVAQYYDNVWIYTKDVTQKYNADNRLDFGVSKDLVSDAIKDFGVKLYQNNFSKNDLYTAFLGLTPGGALFPFPEITSSLPAPTGFEFVDTLISASNDVIPLDDANKSLYKRIYHNIPYLLKSKGTIAGLRALITSYGIPDTILRISEFGGKDKVNENDWDYYFNKFNYAFKTDGDNFISSSWLINSEFTVYDDVPNSVMFRFKTNGLPTSNIPYSQSLWNKEDKVHLTLRYTGSAYVSSSYSGSIIDPYYQYAHLDFYPNYASNPNESSSVYLPFFDGGWWSVMVARDGSTPNFTLYSGNKIYQEGNNGTSLGFSSSSIITASNDSDWYDSLGEASYFASSSIINGNTYNAFSGSLQEIRYYNIEISESVFKDYIMNPLSIEGNSINSSPNELVFRASLGSELDTSTNTTQVSIHPKVTGSWVTTSSFTSNSDYSFNSTPSYSTNTESYFLDQFPAGIKNRITDKIRYEDNVVPTGDTLSAFRRVTQATEASASYTENINYLEVAFSPQNEINDDIVSQLGYFNIGDYIGDPRQRSSSLDYYPDLNNLSKAYFEKYIKNYDLVDFVRLIKFFDNSLFKMIKDFIPARTSLASGIVIKQHLLERNKYPQPQVSYTNDLLTGSIKSYRTWDGPTSYSTSTSSYSIETSRIVDAEGGPGGMMNLYNSVSTSPSGTLGAGPDNRFNITQSWDETFTVLSGSVTKLNDSQHEFYDGEFSGSCMLITNGELNSECDEFKNVSTTQVPYYAVRFYNENGVTDSDGFLTNQAPWLSDNNLPLDGYISIFREGIFSPVGVEYIKIPKIDGNGVDQSTNLESLTQITIPGTTNVTYQFTSVTEKPTFYLYDVEPNNVSPPLFGKLNYDFTGSIDDIGTYIVPGIGIIGGRGALLFVDIISGSNDQYGFYSFSNQDYTLNTYAQKDLYLRVSGSVTVQSEDAKIGLYRSNQGNELLIQETKAVGTQNLDISYNLSSSTPGDQYWVGVKQNVNTPGTATTCSFSSGTTFFITSSAASATSSVDSVLEPYFSSDFSRALDCQPLLNNVQGERANPFLQDLDYNTSQTVPVNYQAVVSESATKATVPESNYTQLSSANIRYNGSKIQSQQLNKWTFFNNIGTLGKSPSINNENALVTYCEWIGGLTPDVKGVQAASISYIINDGDEVREPNLTEGAITDIQFAFPQGENCVISLTDPPAGEGMEILNGVKSIYRGGVRVEPILYTQKTSSPGSYTASIELISSDPSAELITNITAKSNFTQYNNINSPSDLGQIITTNPNPELIGKQGNFPGGSWNPIYDPTGRMQDDQGSNRYFKYNVSSGSLSEGVGFTVDAGFYFVNTQTTSTDVTVRMYKNNDQLLTDIATQATVTVPPGGPSSPTFIPLTHTFIPGQNIQGNDEIIFLAFHDNSSFPGADLSVSPAITPIYLSSVGTYFNVFQNPLPNPLPPIVNPMWEYPTSSLYNEESSSNAGIIFSPDPNSPLNVYYDSGVKQKDLPENIFFPINLDWSLQPGDEFRYADNEERVWQVKDVYSQTSNSPNRISPTGSVEVHFTQGQVSGSLDLNEFFCRRFVEDGSLIYFKGVKPSGATGPAIIKPQYVTKPLEKSAESFVLLLAERGLIT